MLLLTGALTSKPYAFNSRPWELRSVQSIDTLDGMGSNIRIDFKETEVLRILPRRNPDINENWISDKTRFFYDGLKRQRLTSPYMMKNGGLKAVKWKKAISTFSSVLKVFSLEYGPSSVGIVAGSSLDLEALYAIREFSMNTGFSFLGIDSPLKVSLDNPKNYKFQTSIADFEKSDFCLLVGTNPRFEASTLNLRFRKLFRKGNTAFAAIGDTFASTFPINFLGFSSTTLISIVEGRHPICKALAQAKNPSILLGSKVLERVDGRAIHSLLNEFASTFSKIFKKKLSINLLHTEANSVGSFELGIKPFLKSDLTQCKVLYAVGVQNSAVFNKRLANPSVFVLQSSHGDKHTQKADIVLPSYTFVEKTGIYYNTEARPQKSQRALIGPNLSRDDWKILGVLQHSLEKQASYETKTQLLTEISKLLPSSYYANSWFEKTLGSSLGVFEFGAVARKKGRIYNTPFKLFIEDFYMTSPVCESSKTMAKASDLLRSYTNNYKFLAWSSIKGSSF